MWQLVIPTPFRDSKLEAAVVVTSQGLSWSWGLLCPSHIPHRYAERSNHEAL